MRLTPWWCSWPAPPRPTSPASRWPSTAACPGTEYRGLLLPGHGPGQLAGLAPADVHVAVDAAVQAEEPQAWVLRGRSGAGERGHPAPVERDQVPGQRLDSRPVAGRADDRVGSAAGAVGEADPRAVEPVDAGLHESSPGQSGRTGSASDPVAITTCAAVRPRGPAPAPSPGRSVDPVHPCAEPQPHS